MNLMTNEICNICPIECGADRRNSVGFCGVGKDTYVARAALHMYEEPCISGTKGSGTIFFCGCNLSCVFCQNYDISSECNNKGKIVDANSLAEIMIYLQEKGANNINLVTPTPHILLIMEAIAIAKNKGLNIPIVYNTNGYEKVETLKMLEGLVDIYLPDFKYATDKLAVKFSSAPDYFNIASNAIKEMYRQVGLLVVDDNGIAKKGLIIRHLVLPCCVDETRKILDYLSDNFPSDICISLMSQYVPDYKAVNMPPLNRKLLKREYERAVDYCISKGFTNVFIQKMSSAERIYTPDFNIMFEDK